MVLLVIDIMENLSGPAKSLVIDTGEYVDGSDDIFEKEIRKQVELALLDNVIFLVDAKDGITDLDQAVVDLLRKSNKKVVLCNKIDN